MTDTAYLNSDAFGRRLALFFEPAFLGGFDRIVEIASERQSLPDPAEVLATLGCTRDELVAFLAVLEAKARIDETPFNVDIFGFAVDVSAVLHVDEGAGLLHWTFKPWSAEGLMLA
ncbi:hypothetical protein ASG43_11510 [Aureimonas sp. Leaf454]|uniref:hypothetical protein n=1 Tax=Aureimonas sp. Leaf454 TaxID=1736381 RepID=UPI0006FD2F82|nr:hypothetical protein [Aureimonas sp. Leaf454]KQT46250.1 hypothetical protein ASG43_11510 [Aureimonas sp. Leaf454]